MSCSIFFSFIRFHFIFTLPWTWAKNTLKRLLIFESVSNLRKINQNSTQLSKGICKTKMGIVRTVFDFWWSSWNIQMRWRSVVRRKRNVLNKRQRIIDGILSCRCITDDKATNLNQIHTLTGSCNGVSSVWNCEHWNKYSEQNKHRESSSLHVVNSVWNLEGITQIWDAPSFMSLQSHKW